MGLKESVSEKDSSEGGAQKTRHKQVTQFRKHKHNISTGHFCPKIHTQLQKPDSNYATVIISASEHSLLML